MSRPIRMPPCLRPAGIAALALALAAPAWATPPGSPASIEALDVCTRADGLTGAELDAALAEVRRLAEGALAADARDARAHFALFCATGKEMRAAGLGLGQLFALRRLRRQLEATLALAPDDPDALAAQGALLFSLPRLLGGDRDEAERLLRRALAADPANGDARCFLARALDARGADEEARALQADC